MDKFTDFLVYLIPIVIFIASSVFSKQKEKAQQRPAPQQDIDISKWFDIVVGGEEKEDCMPEPAVAPEKTFEGPQYVFESAENDETVHEEGVQAITVEHYDDDSEKDTAGISDFDARTAIIYSTIIDRKYC